MRGDVLEGAEDPLLELDVLRNRLEDELASPERCFGAGTQPPRPNQRYRRRELQVTRLAGESPVYPVGSSLTLKFRRFSFFDGAVRVGGN
jgi:hypothetical protein